jgi:hypothetical protein
MVELLLGTRALRSDGKTHLRVVASITVASAPAHEITIQEDEIDVAIL